MWCFYYKQSMLEVLYKPRLIFLSAMPNFSRRFPLRKDFFTWIGRGFHQNSTITIYHICSKRTDFQLENMCRPGNIKVTMHLLTHSILTNKEWAKSVSKSMAKNNILADKSYGLTYFFTWLKKCFRVLLYFQLQCWIILKRLKTPWA